MAQDFYEEILHTPVCFSCGCSNMEVMVNVQLWIDPRLSEDGSQCRHKTIACQVMAIRKLE